MNKPQPAHPFFSYVLVFLQFALIAGLLFNTPLNSVYFNNLAVVVIQVLGAALGLWAVLTMRFGHFNIIPDPMPDIKLVTKGPYQFIRHPMYASILLFFLPTLLTQFSLVVVGLYINLIFVLIIGYPHLVIDFA